MNKRLKIVGIALIAAFILLLFMSKTIYSYNITEVTAVMPKTGKLKKEELTSGIAKWRDVSEKYLELSGYVEEIYVQEGDQVEKGDPIISFRFDRDDLEKQRQKLGLDKNSLSLSVENIEMKIANIKKQAEGLKNETYDAAKVSDYEINQQLKKIGQAKEALETQEKLFAAGAVPQSDVEEAQRGLTLLEDEYKNMEETYETQIEEGEKSLADKEKDRRKKLEDYEYDLASLNQELKENALRLQELNLQEAAVAKSLAEFSENQKLYAQEGGFVLNMEVKKGQFVSANQLIYSIGTGTAFLIECEVNLKNNFIDIGDSVKLGNTDKSMEGVVTKLTAGESGKTVTVLVESDQITQGETFDIRFYKESGRNFTLIPSNALRMDSDGPFVYYIKEREGILGTEYYVDKVRVSAGDSDNEHTAITSGITFFEPLAGYSNKSLADYDTIKVKNERDFFVK